MKSETIVYCVVALLLGMLLANMLKNVCGCKNIVEGQVPPGCVDQYDDCNAQSFKKKGDECRGNCECCSANCDIPIFSDQGTCGDESWANDVGDFVHNASQKYL